MCNHKRSLLKIPVVKIRMLRWLAREFLADLPRYLLVASVRVFKPPASSKVHSKKCPSSPESGKITSNPQKHELLDLVETSRVNIYSAAKNPFLIIYSSIINNLSIIKLKLSFSSP